MRGGGSSLPKDLRKEAILKKGTRSLREGGASCAWLCKDNVTLKKEKAK